MDKVLVIGGAGFIGSNTVKGLLNQGFKVTVLDNLSEPTHSDNTKLPGSLAEVEKDITFVKRTLFNKSVLSRELSKADYVYHLAAFQDYRNEFSTYVRSNVESTALIYELIIEDKLTNVKRVVVAGSQAVYGEGVYLCECSADVEYIRYPEPRKEHYLSLGIYTPECPHCGKFLKYPQDALTSDMSFCIPTSIYSLSKRQQVDTALFLGKKYDIETVCLNYSIVQGPWQSPYNLYSGLLRNVIVAESHKVNPVIFEDGTQLRDYVHVDDVVDSNIKALTIEPYKTYNVCGNEVVSNIQYTERILKELSSDLVLEIPGYYRVGDTKNALSQPEKLFTPTRNITQMIKDTAIWYDEYVDPKLLPNPKDVLNKMLDNSTLKKAFK